MDWLAIFQPFALAIVGGLTAHLLAYRRERQSFREAVQREREARRREQRTEYLKTAYFDLLEAEYFFSASDWRQREANEKDQVFRRFNSAFNGILIYGSAKQADLLWSVLEGFQRNDRLDLGALTNSIREELRLEIGNDPLDGDFPVVLMMANKFNSE